MLYTLPRLFDTEDYLQNLADDLVEACDNETLTCSSVCDEDIFELCQLYMTEYGSQFDSNVNRWFDLFIELKRLLNEAMVTVNDKIQGFWNNLFS